VHRGSPGWEPKCGSEPDLESAQSACKRHLASKNGRPADRGSLSGSGPPRHRNMLECPPKCSIPRAVRHVADDEVRVGSDLIVADQIVDTRDGAT
jgi:hypothetical protein